MQLQIVIAGGLPFALVGEGGNRLLAGIEEVRNEALILHALVAAGGLDLVVVGLRIFRILERQIGIAQERLPRAGGTVVVPISLIWNRIATKPTSATVACAICASVPIF